ncbi:MAG: hypothetical protein WCE75_17110 [Terracidiphilus sp.]
MRKIVKLDIFSTVRVFVAFYALVGLYVSYMSALEGKDKVVCPFGFYYPMTYLTFNLNIDLPHPASWATFFIVIVAVIFYALTGLISGTTVVLTYNLTAKYWPAIRGELEPLPAPAAPPAPAEPAAPVALPAMESPAGEPRTGSEAE